ncbi:palmitoyltransferase [Geosmithia morbida]|uniref:Ataxin-10 homolog n=1 Tax=Geosmithia morbida TaxID=1094350 RepID=A0A9P4Z1D1_9HYPO|nr:palmitoyltransferase [Geosmithia morbida]KAF4125634.1 palmitoyltransferase [Geosmithia morbida]
MDPANAMTRLDDFVDLAVAKAQQTPAGSGESIEERCFSAALICLEGHYTQAPPMGPLTTAKVNSLIAKTLEKTHTCRKSREALSRNVAIWIWLTRIFAAAIPSLTTRSVGPLSSLNDPDKGVSPQESTRFIVMNHASIKDDLTTLIKLMHIARNLLVNAEPEVPQDICAAVHFDQMVYQTIILCVNVTSKGYDGEILDEAQRLKLTEITEHYKKLLVTSLQQAHNWTAKHDRNKMSFWFDVLFDDDGAYSGSDDGLGDGSGFRPDVAKQQVQHWLDRNSRMCDTARDLLRDYAQNHADKPPGNLAPIRPLAWNWLPDGMGPSEIEAEADKDDKFSPVWNPDEPDKFEQDRLYGRVSREIDTWWLKARDPNYDQYIVPIPTTEIAQARLDHCKQNLVHRYAHSYRGDHGSVIEALHMIVKSCILDNAGSGLTRAGENLQKTRCRMFLALDCGKSLLRELLVFIAVWEKDEQSLIFQVTTQIIEALHHSALIPYAWNVMRIPKDIISPGQTVLLRLVSHMFRARVNSPAAQAPKDPESKDIKLVHFLFSFFRTRIVPECAALMHLQTQIRQGQVDAAEFPVDSWDMDRAKDGLAQYLDFLTTVAEMYDTREELIKWEATYDLLVILNGLEAAIPKKPLVDLGRKQSSQSSAAAAPAAPDDAGLENPMVERPYSTADSRYSTASSSSPPPPPLQEPAHKFPWAGIKGQIFTILATLLQPPPGQTSPGNPKTQMQIVQWNGIVPLLNSCAYDGHNPFAKERVTICLKWLLDGCETANSFFRELVNMGPQPDLKPPPGGSSTVSTLKVDGILGDVKVQVRSSTAAPVVEPQAAREADELVKRTAELGLLGPSNKEGNENIEEDFMS